MLPVNHKQTERKGSGANPGPLAKGTRKRREEDMLGGQPKRGRVQSSPVPFKAPPSPESPQSGLSTLGKELSTSECPISWTLDAGE